MHLNRKQASLNPSVRSDSKISCVALLSSGKDLSIEEIEVAPPKANEVRIKIECVRVCFGFAELSTESCSHSFTGLCHTDAYTCTSLRV